MDMCEMEGVTGGVEHKICGHEVRQHIKQDEGMECQDDFDIKSKVSVSLCHTPYDELPQVLDVQKEDSVSQIVRAVADCNCNVSGERPVSLSQHQDSCHVAADSHEQQNTHTRFGRIIKPVSRLIQIMSTKKVCPVIDV